MEFIETRMFTEQISKVLTDDEYHDLQYALLENPKCGTVIPGGGGLRKVRWGEKGSGKRGGIRVIYFFVSASGKMYMLVAYRKKEQDDLTKGEIKILKELTEQLR